MFHFLFPTNTSSRYKLIPGLPVSYHSPYPPAVLEGRDLKARGASTYVECSVQGLGRTLAKPQRSQSVREVDFPTFNDAEFTFDPLTERDARDGGDLIIKIMDDRDRVVGETTVSLEILAGGVNGKSLRLDSAGAVVRINARFDDGGKRGGSTKKSVGFASEVSTRTRS